MRSTGWRAHGRLTVLALALMALAAASCFGSRQRGDPSDSAAGSTPDPLGSITVAPGEPIRIGSLLTEGGGANTSVGGDAHRGVELALDFLDGPRTLPHKLPQGLHVSFRNAIGHWLNRFPVPVQQQPLHVNLGPMPPLAASHRFGQFFQKTRQSFLQRLQSLRFHGSPRLPWVDIAYKNDLT